MTNDLTNGATFFSWVGRNGHLVSGLLNPRKKVYFHSKRYTTKEVKKSLFLKLTLELANPWIALCQVPKLMAAPGILGMLTLNKIFKKIYIALNLIDLEKNGLAAD